LLLQAGGLAYCLHAGGGMLVVPSNKLSGFRKVLRAKGYVIPG